MPKCMRAPRAASARRARAPSSRAPSSIALSVQRSEGERVGVDGLRARAAQRQWPAAAVFAHWGESEGQRVRFGSIADVVMANRVGRLRARSGRTPALFFLIPPAHLVIAHYQQYGYDSEQDSWWALAANGDRMAFVIKPIPPP
jgi:hypothetical protein